MLWGADVFVDFDHGLNAAINKIRETLGDSAASPRYIETVLRRGYPFIGELVTPQVPRPDVIAPAAPDCAPSTPPRMETIRSRPWWVAGAALVLVSAGAVGIWWWKLRSRPASPQYSMRPLTADTGMTTTPVLSPDGKLVAYASDRGSKNLDIWLHPLTKGGQPVRLTNNEADDFAPDFSPDGGLIAFRSERSGGGIYLVPALGGEERLLVRGDNYPRFSPDGKTITYCVGNNWHVESAIYTISVAGGTPKRLAADVPWACLPAFAPDGQHILFNGVRTNDTAHDWWITTVGGGISASVGWLSTLRWAAKAQPGSRLSMKEWSRMRRIGPRSAKAVRNVPGGRPTATSCTVWTGVMETNASGHRHSILPPSGRKEKPSRCSTFTRLDCKKRIH